MIHDKAMLVRLNITLFSPNKTDKKLTNEVLDRHGAKSDAGRFTKAILPTEALEGIKKISGEARTFHYTNTLPWSDEGARILPTNNLTKYMDKMREFSSSFYSCVENFGESYQGYVDEARRTLNGMFNENDYPSQSEVLNKFRFKTELNPVPASDDFRVAVHTEEMRNLKADLDERVRLAETEAVKDLYRRLADPLKAMVERLSDPDGKFRDSLVGNVQEMIELIPALNIAGDVVLDELTREARELTRHTPNRLRDDSTARKETARKAQSILDKMAGYSL
jgi:hypothetical protein